MPKLKINKTSFITFPPVVLDLFCSPDRFEALSDGELDGVGGPMAGQQAYHACPQVSAIIVVNI